MRELTGLRVIELGDFIQAPYCGKMLADAGAEVVKIESPHGDSSRRYGPFRNDEPHPDKGGVFLAVNAGKKSVRLDLDSAEGQDSFRRLASGADLLVENTPYGFLEERGIHYPRLDELNPRLVFVSISPFGRTGPYKDYKAHDLQIWHGAGVGHRYLGQPDREPLRGAWNMASHWAAVSAAAAAMMGLLGRDVTGRGQFVDVPAAETIATLLTGSGWVSVYFERGETFARTGEMREGRAASGQLAAKDGHIFIMTTTPGQWEGFVAAMGNPEWAQDPRFKGSTHDRRPYADEIQPRVDAWLRELTVKEVFDACLRHGVPAAPLYTAQDVFESSHLQERGFFVDQDHPTAGKLKLPGGVIRGAGESFPVPAPAPPLGEHTGEVLAAWRSSPGIPAPGVLDRGEGRAGAVGATPGPLQGLRVLNFGWYWAGPLAGQVLGDMGADLLTIETRKRLATARHAPPWMRDENDPDLSYWGHNIYRSAHNLTLNLAHPGAKELFKRLVAVADVLIENFTPKTLGRLGLGYEVLRQVNPGLVMVSMASAGRTGPLADLPIFGSGLGCLAGIDAIQGYVGERPMSPNMAIPDPYNGVVGAFAALAAVWERKTTGRGRHIDISQWEVLTASLSGPLMDYWLNRRLGSPMGNRDPIMAPHGVYPSQGQDRWVSISVETDEQWRALCGAIGEPGLAEDRRFADIHSRLRRQDEIDAIISHWTRPRTNYQVTEMLQRRGIAAFPALSQQELYDDPHYRERQAWVEVDHEYGRETIYGVPWKFSETPGEARPNHPLGSGNRPVLRGLLGMTDAEITRLEQDDALT